MNRWIKATRPPDSDRDVLVYCSVPKGRVTFARYLRLPKGFLGYRGWTHSWDADIKIKVTHWMPVPRAPTIDRSDIEEK
jgi:hypothetical protein